MEKKKPLIHVRGGFSESIGIRTCNSNMQSKDFDDRTRVLLSNEIFRILQFFFDDGFCNYTGYYSKNTVPSNEFCKSILSYVFNERVDIEAGHFYRWEQIYEKINFVIEKGSYNEVLDIIWYTCNWLVQNYSLDPSVIYNGINSFFEKEYVGYRFVSGVIVAITNKSEINEIEEACSTPFMGCQTHLKKAIAFLADREKKDYKNCIKESISAVEAVCQIITGSETATLGVAIKNLKDHGFKIHAALESAFCKLYGYTSDEGGIRHCEGLFISNVSFEEAKFMLVSCSAFVNYLISEYGKVNSCK